MTSQLAEKGVSVPHLISLYIIKIYHYILCLDNSYNASHPVDEIKANTGDLMEAATQPQASSKPPAHMLNQMGNFTRHLFVASRLSCLLNPAYISTRHLIPCLRGL